MKWGADFGLHPGHSGNVAEMFCQMAERGLEYCHKHGPPVALARTPNGPVTATDYKEYEELERWKRLPEDERQRIRNMEAFERQQKRREYEAEMARVVAISRENSRLWRERKNK